MIKVSCAIIIQDNQLLAVQKGPATDHPFQWEFPGGKIKRNENAEQAIIREIKEELLIDIEIRQQLRAVEHDYGNKEIQLIPFVCRITKGDVQLTEHIALKWINFSETGILNWAEADRQLIYKNDSFFSKSAI